MRLINHMDIYLIIALPIPSSQMYMGIYLGDVVWTAFGHIVAVPN